MTAARRRIALARPAGLMAPLLLLLFAGKAWAVEAIVTAIMCEPLARGAATSLTAADDSDLYQSIGPRITRALDKEGHSVHAGAPLDLYYSAVESAVEVRGQGPSLGRIDVRTVNRDARAQLLVNVWSSSKDSIFGGRKSTSGISVSTFLIMTLELNRQDNGRCVWRGEGAVELEGVTAGQVAANLADAIAARLGQTVDKATVPLR